MKNIKFPSFKKIINRLSKQSDNSEKTADVPDSFIDQAELDKKLVFSLAKQRFPTWQQIRYLPRYISSKERIILRVLIALTIVSLGFLLVRYYQRHIVYLPESGGTYVEALVGQPTHINPALAQSDVDRDLTSLLYGSLFSYNENLELMPNIASGYEISEDKKVYTVRLRKDVQWHNGNPLLADDILFTFEIILDADYLSPYINNFVGVSVARVDDHTVTFTLEEPFAPFLSNLTIGILPAHVWNDVSPSNFLLAEYNTKPIGSGPYKFKELVKDRSGNIKSYVMVINENYYGQKPYIEKISFKFYPDFDSATEAVRTGNVDGLSYIPTDYRSRITDKDGIIIHSLQLPQYTALFINQKNELLKSQELKQALAYALDKNKILAEALHGQGKVIDAPILDGFLGYNKDIKKYGYDPAEAARILEEADWKIPEGGGLRQKDGNELKFSLTTVDQPEYLKTAEMMRENWEAIGVGIELKIMNPIRVDKEVIKPRNYETFLYGEILGSDPDPYPFWHSSQILDGGLNLSNFYNKDVDKLLEEARQTDNAEERTSKYIDFQNIIAEEVPAIFLYSPAYDYPVSEKIKGITITRITVPSDRLNGILNWYVKTRLGWE